MKDDIPATRCKAQLIGILMALFGMLLGGCPAHTQQRPNVIIVITDDQGYGDLSCHGNPFLRTPNLDALHGESVRLTDFHVDPTCSPTRAALMTGRYSTRVGVWLTYGGRNHLRKDEVTLADAFRHNGYDTGMFGKWHLGDNYPFRPQDRGFEESLIHGGGVVGETPDFWGNDYYDDTYLRNGELEKVEGYCTDVWFDEAAKFIEKKRDNPFFVYLATNAPHGPLNTPIEDAQPYLDAGIPRGRALFYGMIERIDRGIGRLRDKLEELDLAKDTLVIFMTDNGTAVGAGLQLEGQANRNGFTANGYNAGMRGRKGTAYEGGHRAAGFLSWPGGNLAHGRDVDTLTAHFDLFPTLVEVCNLKMPRRVDFDGESLYALLKGTESQWDERTLLAHHQGRFGERVDDGHLIKGKDFTVMTQDWRLVGKKLYDMRNDSGQRIDVASEHPKVVERLSRRYEAWWEDVSEGSAAYAPFVVDLSKQAEYTFSSQNWHGDFIPYNQHHVRAGMKANGYWAVDVMNPGSYEIELRRWPIEVNAPMNDAVELGPFSPDKHDVARGLLTAETRAFRFVKARLKVGDYDQTLGMDPRQTHVAFSVYLEKGEQKIQSWLETETGETWGAYYVYLRKI